MQGCSPGIVIVVALVNIPMLASHSSIRMHMRSAGCLDTRSSVLFPTRSTNCIAILHAVGPVVVHACKRHEFANSLCLTCLKSVFLEILTNRKSRVIQRHKQLASLVLWLEVCGCLVIECMYVCVMCGAWPLACHSHAQPATLTYIQHTPCSHCLLTSALPQAN